MASASLAKKPATVVREHTRHVRDHAAAMARLTEQYWTGLKRLEQQYFEGVKRITEAITADTTAAIESKPDETPA